MRPVLALALLASASVAARAALPDAGFAEAQGQSFRLAPRGHAPLAAQAAPQAPRRDHVMGESLKGQPREDENAPKPDVGPYPVAGIDVSHYQGDIDWSAAATAKLAFVYIKATEGNDFVDDQFARNWSGAHTAGLARGAYHFYNFCDDGASQAANFIAHVPAAAGALPPTIDLEESDDCAQMPQKAAFRKQLSDFVLAVAAAYGQLPVLYVNGSIYASYFQGEDDPERIWIADVSDRSPVVPGGEAWTFWQYDWHAKVPGISAGEVDRDVFAGTPQDLAALRAPGLIWLSSAR